MDEIHATYDGPKAFVDGVTSAYNAVQDTLTRTEPPIVITGRAGRGPQYATDVMGSRVNERNWPINVSRLLRQLISGEPEAVLREMRDLVEHGDGTTPIASQGINYRTAVYSSILDAIIVSPEAMALSVARQPIQRADPDDKHKLGVFTGFIPYDIEEALILWDFGSTTYNQAIQNSALIENGQMNGMDAAEAKIKLELGELETIAAALVVRRRWKNLNMPNNRVIETLQAEMKRLPSQAFLRYVRDAAEESFSQQMPVTKLIGQTQFS